MAESYLLQIKNLKIALKVDKNFISIVDGVDLSLEPGKVLGLVGESGCGKSVTALALLRLLPKELKIVDGKILFYGQNGDEAVDIAKLESKGRDIQKIRGGAVSMIFQEPMSSFSPLHTIGYQIMEVIQLHLDASKEKAREITIELLERVGIGDPERAVDCYPGEFSGGMRQRAMIAKALSCNPSLLIADEPTTALDVTIQAQILKLMRDMQQEFGSSIIFISHDLGVVGQMADEVAIMYMGKIVEQGPTEEIFKNPQHPYTVNLLAAIPRLGDLETRKRLTPIKGTVPGLFSRPSACAFHPRCNSFMSGTCDGNFPELREVSENHFVACYLYTEEF
ncbi:MAG: ABC transporter ATP-binding protein [Deltaproteobacteria bacterium]|jgi:peptide/nickel transport system ATP-binding protein|nr:ABC transporter ATP-binding protein [Deltaproteobacteria bacterium]